MKTWRALLTLAMVFFLAVGIAACDFGQGNRPIATEVDSAPSIYPETSIAFQRFPTTVPKSSPTLIVTKIPEQFASSTPKPTSPLIEKPLSGILYQTDRGLFLTDGYGKSRKLISLGKGDSAQISPDGAYALVIVKSTSVSWLNQYLVNLETGDWQSLLPLEGYNLTPFRWINRRPLTMIASLFPEGFDLGYTSNVGTPVLRTLDGDLTMLDPVGSGLSGAAASPDGGTVAYDLDGVPWLYDWEHGAHALDPTRFGLLEEGNWIFADPSWSPGGQKLAWTFVARNLPEGGTYSGFAIFDFQTGKSVVLKSYDVINYEGSRPQIAWSANERFISVWHYQNASDSFIWEMIAVDGSSSRILDGFLEVWSPVGSQYLISRYDAVSGWSLNVENPGEEASFNICCGIGGLWSPDGSQILTYAEAGQLFWLTDIGSNRTVQVDLPPGSEIRDWRESGP